MQLSFVIVNWNTKDLLINCLQSIYDTVNKLTFEIFVVDNASSDGSVEIVRKNFPKVKIIQNPKNLGFAAANNKAFRKMQGSYALLLNTDTILTEGSIDILYNFMEATPSAGIACGQLLNDDDSKQNSIANFPTLLPMVVNETILRILLPKKYPSKRKNYTKPIEVDSCIGACMIVRKKGMDKIGFLDEDYFFYFEETDWAYRFKQGDWKIYFVPNAKIYHLQGQSAGYNVRARMLFYESRSTYLKKWRPKSYFLFQLIILARLAVNISLNLFAFLITLGSKDTFRKKVAINSQLLFWYLRGCPKIISKP